MDLAGLSREELVELVGQLLRHAAALEARIAELEGQQKPPAAAVKKPEPPSWVKANRPDRPRKERKKRTHGFARLREEPTHRVEHATASCPDCQVPLLDGRVCGSRQVITLPRVRARVTEHLVLERACPKCRKRWTPEPDWNSLTAGRRRVGISVQSEVSVLREECRLPFRVIQRYLKWRFGLRLSVGELVALVRGVAERGREEYDRLRQEIRASPVVYGDETGWREDGRNGYLWSFSTPQVRYFLYRPSRGRTVVEEVLGDEFEGVLVSDFYGAYNVYQGPHQRCWVHLLRDIHKLNEQYPQHQNLAEWSQQVREVYGQARTRPGTAGHGATVPAGKATTALPAATMVYLPPLPGRRRAHAGAMPASGTVLARVVHLRRRAPIGCGQQRGRAEPASAGGEPEDQRGHPFGPGKRYQEHLDFFVRHLAPARTQPLPRPTVRPLQAPTCPTLNTYVF